MGAMTALDLVWALEYGLRSYGSIESQWTLGSQGLQRSHGSNGLQSFRGGPPGAPGIPWLSPPFQSLSAPRAFRT